MIPHKSHEGMEEQKAKVVSGEERLSPVQYTIKKIKYKKQK